ncbi:Uncharacterised protein [Klebsiella grimontii]|uniref:Uncharacterized protein n=1 Tax=Klebsiella grimontii TaxID=2058152 RepID=A0A7H4P3G6_9ENTR|nr:Uncharacterised protein [Klebsiella grimontii]
MDDGGEHHLLWAQEPISGWCFGRIYSGISPALVDSWLSQALDACPARIQCLEIYAHAGFQPARADLSCATVAMAESGAVQLSERLADVIPALDEPDATLQRLCALWNQGRTQKKARQQHAAGLSCVAESQLMAESGGRAVAAFCRVTLTHRWHGKASAASGQRLQPMNVCARKTNRRRLSRCCPRGSAVSQAINRAVAQLHHRFYADADFIDDGLSRGLRATPGYDRSAPARYLNASGRHRPVSDNKRRCPRLSCRRRRYPCRLHGGRARFCSFISR